MQSKNNASSCRVLTPVLLQKTVQLVVLSDQAGCQWDTWNSPGLDPSSTGGDNLCMLDAHFHLDFFPEDELRTLLGEALRCGVRGGVLAGVWTDTFEKRLLRERGGGASSAGEPFLRFLLRGESFSRAPSEGSSFSGPFEVVCAHGLHPETLSRKLGQVAASERQDFLDGVVACFEEQVRAHAPLIFAIGETGFDAHDHLLSALAGGGLSKAELLAHQWRAFEACVRVAVRCGLPLILHSRGAWSHTLQGIGFARQAGVPAMMIHCYGGPPGDVARLVAEGVFLSFGGVPTWERAVKVREAFVACPKDALLIETDAPDLPFESAEGVRPRRHEPKHLANVMERLAAVRGVTAHALAEVAEENVRRFLGMPSCGAAVPPSP